MDTQTMAVAMLGQLIGATVVLSLIAVWYKTRRGAAGPASDDLKRLSAQIEQLHGAVETVAIEVERISEGQRFTTKLLAERAEKTPAAR